MTVAAWRLSLAGLGMLLSALLIAGGEVLVGVVTACVIALWLVDRARAPESLGARFLQRRAELEFAKVLQCS